MSEDTNQTPLPQDGEILTQDAGTVASEHSSDPTGDSPVDYKEKFAASSREAQKLMEEKKQLEASYRQKQQEAQSQLQQMQQQLYMMSQQSQQQRQQPSYGANYLTSEEEQAYKKARDDYDYETMEKLRDLKEERRIQTYNQQMMQQIVGLAQQGQQIQAAQSALGSAPELKDESIRSRIMQEAMRIQSDPGESVFIKPDPQPEFHNGVPVSRFAVDRALWKYRAQHGTAKQQADAMAGSSAHVNEGPSDGPSSASPNTTGTFRPSIHLTANERQMLRTRAAERYYGSDPDQAYNKYWKALPEDERKSRLDSGRVSKTGPEKKIKFYLD